MKTVTVNRIIPFSSVDGPGNRTAIFLQACNINCKYCHNPETRKLCIGCGICAENCPAGALSMEGGQISYDPSKCVQCDTCIHVCPNDSSPKTSEMTVEEILKNVKKQIPFIRGITVSGGECMLYPEILTDLFKGAKELGLTTLIDSNGTIPFRGKEELLAVTDGVMLDIKAFFEEDHIRVTDHGNKTVLENAAFLAEKQKLFEVRCVITEDLYDPKKNLETMADFLQPIYKICPFRIKLIAYRPMGVRAEYAAFRVPSNELLEEEKRMLNEKGFEEIIII